MTETHTKTIKSGLSGFVHLLDTVATWKEDSEQWLKQIAAMGETFQELSQMDMKQRTEVRESLEVEEKELFNTYLKIRNLFSNIKNNKEKNASFVFQTFADVTYELFETFDEHIRMLTDETFGKMKLKFGAKAPYDLALAMAEFMDKNYGEIMVEEVVTATDRFLDWQKLRANVITILLSFSLIDRALNGNPKTVEEVAKKLRELPNFENGASRGADHLFESGHAEDWIRRTFKNNFDPQIKIMLDRAEGGLKDLANFIQKQWWDLTGTKGNYKVIANRAHIQKEDKKFSWRITGYKIFEKTQCIVAENLFPPGVQGSAVDVCVVMFRAPPPDTTKIAKDHLWDPKMLEAMRPFRNEKEIVGHAESAAKWVEEISKLMVPFTEGSVSIRPLLLFINSTPCVNGEINVPSLVNTEDWTQRQHLISISDFNGGSRPMEVVAYANWRDRLTIKTLFTILYY